MANCFEPPTVEIEMVDWSASTRGSQTTGCCTEREPIKREFFFCYYLKQERIFINLIDFLESFLHFDFIDLVDICLKVSVCFGVSN